MEPRLFYINWATRSLYIRVRNTVFALKSRRIRPFWSERNRVRVRVLPLFGGWRITMRDVSTTSTKDRSHG